MMVLCMMSVSQQWPIPLFLVATYVYILFQLLLLVVFLLYTNANVLIDLHCVCCHVNIWYCIMKCSLTVEAGSRSVDKYYYF